MLAHWDEHAVPDAVGDVEVDQALDEYRMACARARALAGELRALVNEHELECRRFAQRWRDWITHRQGEEPSPEPIAEFAQRVSTVRDSAETAIHDVGSRWGRSISLVGSRVVDRAQGRSDEARAAFLSAVAALVSSYSSIAHADAVARWAEDPETVSFTFTANAPTVMRLEGRDANGVSLERIVTALRELVQ